LKEIGLEPERARMVNLSSAMGAQFVEIAKEMTATIAKLGPNPLKTNPESNVSDVGTVNIRSLETSDSGEGKRSPTSLTLGP
jgi:hypothetical protein